MINKKVFFGASWGTMIEYYDFALFATFLPILTTVFFPASSDYEALIKGYFVFLIAMIARPIGALFFGTLGDGVGRSKALLGSMYGIALATFVIGITPSYQTIGIFAAILVIVAKAVQTFCFGGEYNGAGVYLVEHATKNHEGMIGCLLTATTLFGSLIASFFGMFLTLSFMPVWGWRVAFILGSLVGVVGIIYRKYLKEPPTFQQADLKKQSLKKLIKLFPIELLTGFFIGGLATIPFTTILTFIAPVLTSKGFLTAHEFMIWQTGLLAFAIISLIPAGFLANRFGSKKIMLASCALMIVLAYPLLVLIDSQERQSMFLAMTVMIVLNEFFLGPAHAYLKNLFPGPFRYRGASFGFCLGMSILGGCTPLLETYLYQGKGVFSAVAGWLIFINLGAMICILVVDKKQTALRYSIAS